MFIKKALKKFSSIKKIFVNSRLLDFRFKIFYLIFSLSFLFICLIFYLNFQLNIKNDFYEEIKIKLYLNIDYTNLKLPVEISSEDYDELLSISNLKTKSLLQRYYKKNNEKQNYNKLEIFGDSEERMLKELFLLSKYKFFKKGFSENLKKLEQKNDVWKSNEIVYKIYFLQFQKLILTIFKK